MLHRVLVDIIDGLVVVAFIADGIATKAVPDLSARSVILTVPFRGGPVVKAAKSMPEQVYSDVYEKMIVIGQHNPGDNA